MICYLKTLSSYSILHAIASCYYMNLREHTGFQHQFNMKWQAVRLVIYTPILAILSRLGITAGMITLTRLVLGIIFLVVYPFSPNIALVLITAALILDSFDGALARMQGTSSDRGKFFDIVVDYMIFVFIISSFLQHKISPALVLHVAWLVGLLWLLAIIYKEEHKQTDWIIKPYPREIYVILLPIIAFFASELRVIDLRTTILWCVMVYSVGAVFIYGLQIGRRWRIL